MSLVTDKLTKAYSENNVLRGISISLTSGIYLLTGPSGCGKTTFLRILSGLEKADGGSYRYDGGVAFMFQEARLFPWLSAFENVREVSECGRDTAEKLLCLLGLEEEKSKMPHELSGGMQRRVSLARTLSRQAGLYLFDEPLAGLDAQLRTDVCTVMQELLPKASVAIVVSHELKELRQISNRELKFEGGKII